MTLLERLKEKNDKKYISFWGLISHMIDLDESRDDESYVSKENYISLAEALLRLKIHEKIRYFIYDPENFIFEQIEEPEANQAKIYLNALLPSSGKKLTPTEVTTIQRKFKNYFWLKESVEQILPDGVVNFINPNFFHTGEHQHLDVKLSSINNEELIDLQQQNQSLRERISELEAKQGYLDRSNEYFSIEMKLCHDTWNNCYNNGKVLGSSNSKRVEKYLSTYPDFKVGSNAAERIGTIVNPKKTLAEGK